MADKRPWVRLVFPVIGERQWVTIALFGFALVLLAMAENDRSLWNIEVFKVIIQAIVLTGLLNMVAAFHFSSNKGSETSRENTGKAFDAIKAAANSGQPNEPDVTLKPGETAQAEEQQD